MAVPTTAAVQPTGSQSKRRFVTLDALRGLAAIGVVLVHSGHLLGTYSPPRGQLAVDLFFALSGFVIAHSYDERFAAGLTVIDFMVLRAKRLGPIYVLGGLLGLATCLGNLDLSGLRPSDLFYAAPFNLIGLPVNGDWRPGVSFPLNVVFWSLFYEFWFLNLGYALFWKGLQGRALLILIAILGVAFLFAARNYHTISFGFVWPQLWAGFIRSGLSFCIGIWLARHHRRHPPRLQVPSLLCLVLLALAMFLPLQHKPSRAVELASIFILFPALVYFGAAAIERRPKIGELLGDMSYALYAIHYPLWVAASWLCARLLIKPAFGLEVAFVALASALALGCAKADEKFRAHFFGRKRTAARG